jgi:hypothetical protein
MRAAPALQVTVSGRGAWRWSLAAVTAASVAVTTWWVASLLGSLTDSIAIAAGIAGVTTALVSWRALSPPAFELRFDGQRWELGVLADARAPRRAGDLTVVMDLGPWMLLRFDAPADQAHRRRCRRWLAVGHRELALQWHALRCAVYSPRPGTPSGSRDAPVDP